MLADVAQVLDQRELARASRGCWRARPGWDPARSRGSARAGRGSPPRCARSSRRRAGSAPTTAPTGRRSSRSRRRRARPAVPPCRWKRIRPKIGTRWPTWSESAGRVEADVAGDRPARRQALRQARRGRVEDAPPLEVRRAARRARPTSAAGGRIAHPDVTALRAGTVDGPARSARSGIHPLHGIFTAEMQTSLSGGSAVAGSVTAAAPAGTVARGQGRRPSRSPSSCSLVLPCWASPVPPRRSPGTRTCREDLEDPKQALDDLGFTPADGRVRPHGKVQLAQARRRPPRGRDLRRDPARPHRRDDLDRGQDVLGELGLRPGRLRRGRDRHHPGPRPRWLDDHPAARARATASRPARFERQRLRAQGQGDHPVDPPDRGVPGRGGKQQIIEKYLNQNFYGNRSYGVAAAARSYWHKDLKDLTLAQMAILAGIPQSPTRFDLVKNAVEETYKDEQGRRAGPSSWCRPTSEIVQRRNFILDLMKTRSARSTHVGKLHRRRLRGRQGRARDPRLAGDRPVARAAVRVAGARRARPDPVRRRRRVREDRHRRLQGHDDARLPDAADRREVGLRRGDRAQRGEPRHDPQGPRHPAQRVELDQGPRAATTSTTPPPGVIDYRTGEVLAYTGSASYTAKGNKKFQPQFDVLSDGWRQPGSSIKPLVYLDRHRRPDDDRRDDVHGRRHELRAVRLEGRSTRPRPTASSAARSGCAARSSSRSTSRRSRPASSTASTTSSTGSRTSGSTFPSRHGAGRVREHRHPRHPPDRHDQRLRRRSRTAAS